MKSNYSDPKIFTGGVDINAWSKLSQKEKNTALDKIVTSTYSSRNPNTGKLVRQTEVYMHKGKCTRLYLLKVRCNDL